MKKPYLRALAANIAIAMKDTPVVLINGPRQSGKTTLAQQYNPHSAYFTLDDENLLQAARQDPINFIKQIDRGIIDEIQRAPELLRAIKLSVDKNRNPGRFLLTGSANLLALPQIGDSLAGRMEILTLLPLSTTEIQRCKSNFLANAQKQNWPLISANTKKFDCIAHALMGGYPEMLMRKDVHRRNAWAKAYIKAIIERDIKDIASVERLADIPRLLNILAQLSGQLTNFTLIGGQLGLDSKTTQRYIGILENLFLIKRLWPWHRNKLNRLVKTPKLYFLDSGLLTTLSRITLATVQADKSIVGPLLETWVYNELLKIIATLPDSWDIFYYRDKDQNEVDFVLETPEGRIIGIEVKASSTVFNHDLRGLKKLAELTGNNWLTGIILYQGEYQLSFGNGLWAVPFATLCS